MSDQSGEPIGSVLGNYRIERLLGRGGFAAVYLAEDVRPQLRRKVALKVLNPTLAEDPVFRERFLRESLLAVGLDDHPSIVPVHDAGEDDGRLYIAMRFIDGIDLKQAIDAQHQLAPEYVSSVTTQVAGALDAAHAAGLVHRDVKPANILLSRNGQRAYLADFGLTKRADGDQGLTQTPGFMGTTFYSPPEQFEGVSVGPPADIYALGAVIYHCLIGSPPFPGTPESVIGAHLTKPVPLVTAKRPDLPPAINEVITKAMAKEPADRYQSAGLLAEELRRAITSDDQTEHGAGLPPLPLAGDPAATNIGAAPSSGSGSVPPPPFTPGPASGPTSSPPGYASNPPGYASNPPSYSSTPPGYASNPPGATSGPTSTPPGMPAPGPDSVPPGGPTSTPPSSFPVPPAAGPNRSRGKVLGIAAAVLVVIAVAVAAVVVLGKGSSSPPTTEPTKPAKSAFPSKAETALMATLPAQLRSDCSRDTESLSDSSGAVRCTFKKEKVSDLVLASFSSPAAMKKAYDKELSTNGPRDLIDNSDCKWLDGAQNDFKGSAGNGQVACYNARDHSYLVWTNTKTNTLGIASYSDTSHSFDLYTWWSDLVKRSDSAVGTRAPSSAERKLLTALPDAFRDSCVRNSDDISNGAGVVASVQCYPRQAGDTYATDTPVVTYYAYDSSQSANTKYYDIVSKSGIGLNTGSDACPGETNVTDAETKAETGRRICYLDNGTATIAWVDNKSSILGIASADDGTTSFDNLNDKWWYYRSAFAN